MISLEGAGLLAQVIPVALLVLAVERRALGPEQFPSTVPGAVWFVAKYAFTGLTTGLSVVAVALCIISVSSELPLTGWRSVLVAVAGTALGFLAVGVIVRLSMRAFWADPTARTEDET